MSDYLQQYGIVKKPDKSSEIFETLFPDIFAIRYESLYVLKAFGQFLMETFSLVGWIIHLSFVGAAGDVKPEFVL